MFSAERVARLFKQACPPSNRGRVPRVFSSSPRKSDRWGPGVCPGRPRATDCASRKNSSTEARPRRMRTVLEDAAKRGAFGFQVMWRQSPRQPYGLLQRKKGISLLFNDPDLNGGLQVWTQFDGTSTIPKLLMGSANWTFLLSTVKPCSAGSCNVTAGHRAEELVFLNDVHRSGRQLIGPDAMSWRAWPPGRR